MLELIKGGGVVAIPSVVRFYIIKTNSIWELSDQNQSDVSNAESLIKSV